MCVRMANELARKSFYIVGASGGGGLYLRAMKYSRILSVRGKGNKKIPFRIYGICTTAVYHDS